MAERCPGCPVITCGVPEVAREACRYLGESIGRPPGDEQVTVCCVRARFPDSDRAGFSTGAIRKRK